MSTRLRDNQLSMYRYIRFIRQIILLQAILLTQTVSAQSSVRWMTELSNILGQYKIYEIFIPGTHDSGSWLLGASARAQTFDFKKQLMIGSRYFDLRITHIDSKLGYKSDTFYLHHGGESNPGLELKPQLQVVKSFIDSNPGEVVILHVRYEWLCSGLGLGTCKGMNLAEKYKLDALFKEVFGARNIASNSEIIDREISYLQVNKKIIIDWAFWGSNGYSDIISMNYTHVGQMETFSSKIDKMYPYHTNKLEEDRNIRKLKVMHPVIWGIELHRTVKLTHPLIIKWIKGWYDNDKTRKGMNVIAFDYIEESRLVDLLISYNRELSPSQRSREILFLEGKSVYLKNVKTNRILSSTGKDLTNEEGREGGWSNSPSVVGADNNYIDLATRKERGKWQMIPVSDSDNLYILRNYATQRYLLATGEIVDDFINAIESEWLTKERLAYARGLKLETYINCHSCSGIVGADKNYDNRGLWRITQVENGAYLIQNVNTNRFLFSTGYKVKDREFESLKIPAAQGESNNFRVIGSVKNLEDRALWYIGEE